MFHVLLTLPMYYSNDMYFVCRMKLLTLYLHCPHTNNSNVNVLEIPSADEDDENNMVGNVMSETQQLLQDIAAQRGDVTTVGGKSRLIIPTVFFKQQNIILYKFL